MEDSGFEYIYSAPTAEERKRAESIRRLYAPEAEENNLRQLAALKHKVRRIPAVFAAVTGIAGMLIFGLGLSAALRWSIVLFGAALMCAGALCMAAAYPIYRALSFRLRRRYGRRIAELSEGMLKNNRR